MAMTDPIADMLTRVRNALKARHKEVSMPCSKVKEEILTLLKEEGYINDYKTVEEDGRKALKVELKYGPANRSVITELKRVSKPGRRVYVASIEIPHILGGLGVAILSTSKGIVTDKKAKKLGVGGELICTVF